MSVLVLAILLIGKPAVAQPPVSVDAHLVAATGIVVGRIVGLRVEYSDSDFPTTFFTVAVEETVRGEEKPQVELSAPGGPSRDGLGMLSLPESGLSAGMIRKGTYGMFSYRTDGAGVHRVIFGKMGVFVRTTGTIEGVDCGMTAGRSILLDTGTTRTEVRFPIGPNNVAPVVDCTGAPTWQDAMDEIRRRLTQANSEPSVALPRVLGEPVVD